VNTRGDRHYDRRDDLLVYSLRKTVRLHVLLVWL